MVDWSDSRAADPSQAMPERLCRAVTPAAFRELPGLQGTAPGPGVHRPISLTKRRSHALRSQHAELERSQEESGYRELRDRIDPLVEAVVANGIYEVAVSREARPELAG